LIKVTTHQIYNEFLQLCADSKESIRLCAPFVKQEIIDDIFSAIHNRLSLKLITNINLQSFHKKASDIGAIKKFMGSGSVYNCTTLHAKFYVFDERKC
jgi:hypothetical protein